MEAAISILAKDDSPTEPEPEPVDVQADDGIAEAAEALEALET
jgi:hypothetical protein